ncbi:hypothetical protein SDC9_186428 [bioreactor metagenome]|uniref:Uncharacterized protein n=1 Tax=bioreactor metagenome TaxID=1076179 RepID=A0A645HU48_9ZZZZ
MTEETDHPRRSHETRPVNHIRLAREQRREHNRIIVRRIFEVGILHHDEGPRRLPETADQGGALPLVDLLIEQPDPRILREHL